MQREQFLSEAAAYIHTAAANRLTSADAARHGIQGLQLFDEPLVAFASAEDPLFLRMKAPGVVGPQFLTPQEWLPGASSVISVFLPFTEALRSSNAKNDGVPSAAWLFGRIEGQRFVEQMSAHMAALLRSQGHQALAPGLDPRFRSVTAPDAHPEGDWAGISYASNWSERHVAYICGLGTFGLSKGLITEKGIAGRFFSIVTDAVFPPTQRAYTDIYEHCTMCGACAARCPAGAITLAGGKDHTKCSAFLDQTRERFAPRFGCGKCQVRVPCESGIPKKKP